jgi:lipoprotein-anchoring transpeptidase ErfK/SrfK
LMFSPVKKKSRMPRRRNQPRYVFENSPETKRGLIGFVILALVATSIIVLYYYRNLDQDRAETDNHVGTTNLPSAAEIADDPTPDSPAVAAEERNDVVEAQPEKPVRSQGSPESTNEAPQIAPKITVTDRNPNLPVELSQTNQLSNSRWRVLAIQLALNRRGISPGSLDNGMGPNTRAAVRAWQETEGLPATGQLDSTTITRLQLPTDPLKEIAIDESLLAGLAPVPTTWFGKSSAPYLGYETVLERVAELSHSHPSLVRQLNPSVDWSHIVSGTRLVVADAGYPNLRARAARIRIKLSERNLRALDADGHLLCFFPCSIGSRVDKRPIGELHVVVAIKDPNYTFRPELFPESPEARTIRQPLILPPGPNNPVGAAWIGLDRPGYGIHGTPQPEDVGRTESHGCFRLANWNAEFLLQLVAVGTPVSVEL